MPEEPRKPVKKRPEKPKKMSLDDLLTRLEGERDARAKPSEREELSADILHRVTTATDALTSDRSVTREVDPNAILDKALIDAFEKQKRMQEYRKRKREEKG